MSGFKLAALYSISPHLMGLCGPKGKKKTKKFLDFLNGKKVSEKEIRKILEKFKGAFFYYKIIAKSNGIRDPFDEKVIRAYWVGNKLLEKVRTPKLKEMVRNDFGKQRIAKILPETSRAHHSFHILVAGPIDKNLILTNRMKDICKISWGRVLKIENWGFQIAKLKVEYQPLLKENRYFLGKPTKREIFWVKGLLPKLKIGDFVSFHWDFALERLSKNDMENLKKYTELSIQTANFVAKFKNKIKIKNEKT